MKSKLHAFLLAACALGFSCSQAPEDVPVRYGNAAGEGDIDEGGAGEEPQKRDGPMIVRPSAPASSADEVAERYSSAKIASSRAPAAGGYSPVIVPSGAAEAHYTVRPKETWYRISRKYGLKPEQLAAANGMKVKQPLSIGMRLRVPAKGQAAADFVSGRSRVPGRFAESEKIISTWKNPDVVAPAPASSWREEHERMKRERERERAEMRAKKEKKTAGVKTENFKERKTPPARSGAEPVELEREVAAAPEESRPRTVPVPVMRPGDLLLAGGFGSFAKRGAEPARASSDDVREEKEAAETPVEEGSTDADGFSLAERLRGVVRRGEEAAPPAEKKNSDPAKSFSMKDRAPDEKEVSGSADIPGDTFIWPVRGKVISPYGPKPGGLYNEGVNISAPEGAPVRSAAGGKVVYSGNELRGYGNLILIKHADGFITTYAHNKENVVRKGEYVRKGQVIARVGNSGNVSGPQLHFGIRKGRDSVDPSMFFKSM